MPNFGCSAHGWWEHSRAGRSRPLTVRASDDSGAERGHVIQGDVASPASPCSAPLSLRRELERKGLHLLSATAPIAYAAGLPRALLVWVLAAMLLAAVLIEVLRRTHSNTNDRFRRITGHLLRAHEHTAIAGATWLLLAFVIATLVLPPAAAIAAMLAVSLGDAAAAIIGRWLGRTRLPGGKSLEGSAACFFVTAAGAWIVAGCTPLTSVVAGAAAAVAELPSRPFDDNIRVAAAVGAVVWLLR